MYMYLGSLKGHTYPLLQVWVDTPQQSLTSAAARGTPREEALPCKTPRYLLEPTVHPVDEKIRVSTEINDNNAREVQI
jgi:hypothetical protein